MNGGLRVDGLTKRYGSKLAVGGLSFGVAPGEILALAGPNGTGKTTTLLCVAGLLRPEASLFFWQDRPLGPERTRTMALIGAYRPDLRTAQRRNTYGVADALPTIVTSAAVAAVVSGATTPCIPRASGSTESGD